LRPTVAVSAVAKLGYLAILLLSIVRPAMLHAADLTNPRFQTTVTDEQLATVIRSGRGLMPAFPLPDSTVTTLVQLIRLLGQSRVQAEAAASGAPSAASPAANAHPAVTAKPKAPPAPSSR